MPDEDIEMFNYFQIWLYTKEIPLTDKAGKEINSDVIVDLYIFGEARDIPDLQNAAIDAFITKVLGSRQFPTGLLRCLWKHRRKVTASPTLCRYVPLLMLFW